MSRENSFRVGECYFLVGYHDRNLKLPFIETYIFIGHGEGISDAGKYCYFQDAQSFAERGQLSPQDDASEGHILAMQKENLDGIVDWLGLISEMTATRKRWQ